MTSSNLDDIIRDAVTEIGEPWFAVDLARVFAMRAARNVATDDEGDLVSQLIEGTRDLRSRSIDELVELLRKTLGDESPAVCAFRRVVSAVIGLLNGGSVRMAAMHAMDAADFSVDSATQYERRAIALQVAESVRYRKANP